MSIKVVSESSFGSMGRYRGPGDLYGKGFYGFAPADTWTPNVNLYESEICYLVCVDLAGVEKREIEIIVHDNRLRLTGRREVPTNRDVGDCDQRVRVHLMEIDHGLFSREVELPENVDKEGITASFTNGLLWIELPKT